MGAQQRLSVLRASPLRKQGKTYLLEGRKEREPLCVRWLKLLHQSDCFIAKQEEEKCSGHPRVWSRGDVIRMMRSKNFGLEIDSQRDRPLPLGSEEWSMLNPLQSCLSSHLF